MKKTKQSKELATLNEWCEKFTTDLATEVYYALEDQADFVGEAAHMNMLAQFLSGYIAAICYRTLTRMPEAVVDKEEQYKYAKGKFQDIKSMICNAVSAGVTGGVKTWSGKDVDYYCLLKVVPEPVNREMI